MFRFDLLLLAPVGSILALGFAWYLAITILKNDEGTDRMKEIAQAVRIGAWAYLIWMLCKYFLKEDSNYTK